MEQAPTNPVVVVPAKPIHKSVTFWLNVAAVVVVAMKIGIDSGQFSDPDVLAILVAVMNIINRFRTSTAIIPFVGK